MAAPRGHTAGFLLTETLATFVISACVLLSLASIAPTLLHAVDGSVATVQNVDDLSRTLASLQRDLSGLSRSRWSGFEPQPFVFRGGPNSLFFAHREHGLDGSAEIRVIALREIVTDRGTSLVRSEARLPSKAVSFDDLRFGPQRTLATGPVRLHFWYISPINTQPRARSWPSGPRLPAAIEIEAIDAQTTRLIVATRVAIRANADIGCLANSGTAPPPPPGIAAANAGSPPPNANGNGVAGPGPGGPAGQMGAPASAGAADQSDLFCGRDDAQGPGTAPPQGAPL